MSTPFGGGGGKGGKGGRGGIGGQPPPKQRSTQQTGGDRPSRGGASASGSSAQHGSGGSGDRQPRESVSEHGGSGGGRPPNRGGGDFGGGKGGGGYSKAGYGDRPGGKGGYEKKATINVRNSFRHEIPKLKHKKMQHLIQKPGYGSEGRPIKLIANFFSLAIGDKMMYHYDVDIRLPPEAGGGDTKKQPSVAQPAANVPQRMRRLALKENFQLIAQLATEWQVFGGVPYVYDGLRNIYTTKRFKFSGGADRGSQLIGVEFDGFQQQNYEVVIQYTQEDVDLSTINAFYEGILDAIPQQAYQVLEIILKHMPIQILVPIGRSLYSQLTDGEQRTNYVGEGAVMAYGHYQSVRPTEAGPAMCIDRKATVLHFSGKLTEYIAKLLWPRVRNVEDLQRVPFTNDAGIRDNINRHLSGLKIYTTHIEGGRRKYTIDRLIATRPGELEFEQVVRDREGNVIRAFQTTIERYFLEEYGKELHFRNIPCILLKGGQRARHLPVEICDVYPDQPLPRKLISKDITAHMVKKSGQQWPINRFGKIAESADMIAETNQQVMQDFGIHMSTKLMEVPGRVLIKPQTQGDDNRFEETKPLENWFFIALSPRVWGEDRNMGTARNFVRNLVAEAEKKGITIADISETRYVVKCTYRDQTTIEGEFRRALETMETQGRKLDMIMFCIPRKYIASNEIYRYIKYFGDMMFGVITQCVKDENVCETPSGYLTNLLLKINGKLDGKNSIVPEKPPILRRPSMVIGVDVSHPAPADRMLSSVAACVGSYDRDFGKYAASITVQARSRDEIITNFGAMIEQLLTQFKRKNKCLPQTIILFRDGVSESQFETVLDNEYPMLYETCVRMGIAQPKITFAIVQKRHHTRFLPLDPNDGLGKPGNIPPGTVVDRMVVSPVLFEYYLCSHFGLQGTSRPAKYVVLRDNNNLTADEMQKLSYFLCFTYSRSNKSISIPTPVQYAHLAAYRSKLHIVAQNIETEGSERGETQEDRVAREARNAAILNERVNVSEALKTRLYYS